MKIKRTTLILMLTALALGGFVYLYEIRGKQQQVEIQEQQKQVFDFESEEIQSITIKQDSETLTLKKDEEAEEKTWNITVPVDKKANLETVEFLLYELTNLKSDRSITTSASQLSEYGLEKPEITVEIQFKDGKTSRLFLGQPDFDGNLIYSQLEPEGEPPEEVSVLLLSANFKNVLTKPVSEWEQPENPDESLDKTEESTDKKEETETSEDSSEKSPTNPEVSPSPTDESLDKTEESTDKKEETETSEDSSEKSSTNPEVSPSPTDEDLFIE